MAVLKKYDRKIKLSITISFLFLSVCVVVSLGTILLANRMSNDAQKEVYLLNGTAPILGHSGAVSESFDVEAKSHIRLFHHLFFTLVPDDKYINYTIEKAMRLVDETGIDQYNALKEKNFYFNIVSTNSVFSIFCDSVNFDKNTMEWTFYGRQRIERSTQILYRQIITTGSLGRVPRTEGNPHGFIITNWRTVLNKDIEQRQKNSKL